MQAVAEIVPAAAMRRAQETGFWEYHRNRMQTKLSISARWESGASLPFSGEARRLSAWPHVLA